VDLINDTLLEPLVFVTRTPLQDFVGTIVLKGYYSIVDSGELEHNAAQQRVIVSDEYVTEPNISSITYPTDIVPFKPKADIMLIGTARPPFGRPKRDWIVKLQVGDWVKRVRVTGHRHWEKASFSRWKLSQAVSVAEVPLKYELAYGGLSKDCDDNILEVYDSNPVGCGFVSRRDDLKVDRINAPQLESVNHPIADLFVDYVPEGFGPLSPAWKARSRFSGTYDRRWLDTKSPVLPDDFDYAFFNSAPPDLLLNRYLVGDELVQLTGLDPSGTVMFGLPSYFPAGTVVLKDGTLIYVKFFCDTLLIDWDRRGVYLSWRGTFDVSDAGVRDIAAVILAEGRDVDDARNQLNEIANSSR